VLVETYALAGRRLGPAAVRAFRADFAPLVDVIWVDEALHEAGLDVLVARNRRQLSLVDAVSFAAMRQRGLHEVFALDPHFAEEGFVPVG
jgi:predicted nucleic acid-binding protein